MPLSPFPTAEAEEVLSKIRSRRGAAQGSPGYENPAYKSAEFEQDVRDLLVRLFPYSVLSGVRLFSAETRLERELGIEIDNLMHFRFGGTDYVILIEAKNQQLRVSGEKWIATYDGDEKCARTQVDAHIRTLLEYLGEVLVQISKKVGARTRAP